MLFKLKSVLYLACSAGGFWRCRVDNSLSDIQAAILNLENSGELGRGEKFTKPVGGRKKNWGGGRGLFILPRPPPPQTFSHRILSPILRVCNESKMAANHTKAAPTKTACTAGYFVSTRRDSDKPKKINIWLLPFYYLFISRGLRFQDLRWVS